MLEVGRSYSLKMVDGEGYSLTDITVMEVNLPLLKINNFGREEIINTNSLHFISLVLNEPLDDGDDWLEFMPENYKPD